MWNHINKKHDYFSRNRAFSLLFALIITVACGYHMHSSAGKLPSGMQSIGIPTFRNLTNKHKIEQLISKAVLKEFSLRTRTPVNSSRSNVDAVILGEIQSINSVPVTYGTEATGSRTFGSTFLVTVAVGVKVQRVSDSKILWQNNNFLYRGRYVLNADVKDFFSEENPALERLAANFAADLAGAILDRIDP